MSKWILWVWLKTPESGLENLEAASDKVLEVATTTTRITKKNNHNRNKK